MILYAIIIALAGLAIGSFLNVVIFRIDDLKSILNTRSRCRHCQKEIKWYDLIPLVSFVLLRGRCRYCKADLSWQYPIIEAGTALIFVSLFLKFGLSWTTVYYAMLFSLLIVIFVYDYRTQYILDIFSWPLLALAVLGGWYFGGFGVLNMIYGLLVGGGLLALLVIISKERWMGIGDIIIGSALGAMVGFPNAVVLIFLSFIIGSVIGLILISVKKKSTKDAVPFAPFLITAAFISLMCGQYLINWYLGTVFLY